MGGRSGQSIGNQGKTASKPTGKEKLAQLEKKKDQLEQKKAELTQKIKQNLLIKNKTAEDIREGERLAEEYVKTNKELIQTSKEAQKTRDEINDPKTKGTTGNEITMNDIKNGEFILNREPQTNYKISQSDLDKLSDKDAQPDQVNGMQKSKYWFTKDSWKNESSTIQAFADTGLPKTDENYAVLYYTADSKVNTGYYDGQTPTEQDKIYTEALNKSLDKYGNKFDGTTYRGIDGSYANKLYAQVQQQGIGTELTFKGFQSSAYTPEKAFGGDVVIVSKSKQGHMLDKFSHYQGEKEVLYKAGSSFKITGWEEKGGKKYIYLED